MTDSTEGEDSGPHRSTAETSHGSAGDQPGNGTGTQNALSPYHSALAAYRAQQAAINALAQQNALASQLMGGFGYGGVYPSTASYAHLGGAINWVQPAPPQPIAPIEDAGITVGEIEAYRVWEVRDGWLRSTAMQTIWMPNTPMTGKPEGHYGAGVHAWKTLAQALQYGMGMGSMAYGKVALWGDVIEHEIGYRAENAKILTIDGLLGSHRSGALERLRKRYGVGGDENAEPENDAPSPLELSLPSEPKLSPVARGVAGTIIAWAIFAASVWVFGW